MKKILLLFLLLAFIKEAFCDIIPDHSHAVTKCVKIINTADFPDIILIAYTEYPGGGDVNAVAIDPNLCIDKGYKFNVLRILAVKKSYLSNKNLNLIDWKNDKNVFGANIQINPYGGYVDNLTPISSVEEYYKIVGLQDSTLMLFKSKEITKFNNGRPVSIKTFACNSDGSIIKNENSSPENQYNGLLDEQNTIFDFLKALFLTILLETLVLFLLFKTKLMRFNVSNKTLIMTGFVTSFATLPYLWFVLPLFIQSTLFYIIISELSVICIEAIILFGLLNNTIGKAFLASFIANSISFLTGLVLDIIA